MKIMADLDAVNLGLDENEADIAEELQDFDDSFDTRSEASDSGSESSDSQPSISSVSTAPSSIGKNRAKKTKRKSAASAAEEKVKDNKKSTKKRTESPAADKAVNGKTSSSSSSGSTKKKKRSSETESKSPKKSTEPSTTAESQKSDKGAKESKVSSKAKKSRKKSTSSNGIVAADTNTSGNKSDLSDTEKKPTQKSSSESESEDSDSAANIKRNGRKSIVSPEKKSSLISNSNSSSAANSKNSSAGKSYDYMTKLNYLFRDTRFFLIKSNNADNIALSKSKNVWATLPQNDANLSQAFKEARNVLLIFSVNESGKFAGFARMNAPSRRDIPQVAWVLPPSISSKALGGVIEIDWICRKEVSFNCTAHLYNSWNDGKPVKIGRDGQEIEPKVGAELCRLFPEDEKIELTPILRKSKETAKVMREKGIRVIYKPPRSLSSRGGRGGHGGGYHGDRRGGDGGGPMRHKRSYGGPHRPYKMPPHMGPPGSFKRSSSPYRGGGPGAGSRAGGGDAGVPPWERYMTSAAAAEAYVADYMRTMHGQLPPLPFVPPFAQLPLPTAGPGGNAVPPPGPPTMYDQLPPPVRYYDGPPLPDYPPPQQIRPPPPGFDKGPSYEDFASWKNSGLPPAPGVMPPGFPGFGANAMPSANGGGSSAGGSGGAGNMASGGNVMGGANSGPNSYRNRDNNTNSNRSRDRGGARDYHRGGGSSGGRSGERDRHFRAGGNDRGNRNYRDGRR